MTGTPNPLTGQPPLRSCARHSCLTWTADVYCSPDCARIAEVITWPIPDRDKLSVAAMGYGAAVVQADGFGWLDVRAAS